MRQLTYSSLVIALLIVVGCAKKSTVEKEIVTVQNCTVTKQGSEAIISCPDGSQIVVPAEVVVEEVETLVEVPTYILVPRGQACDKKDKKN